MSGARTSLQLARPTPEAGRLCSRLKQGVGLKPNEPPLYDLVDELEHAGIHFTLQRHRPGRHEYEDTD